MSVIQQNSRISHHTTTTGITFSIPPQEDFTLRGTQSWTANNLALSEIGIDELRNKAFVRIANHINELSFIGASGSGGPGSLQSVLTIGNNSGANNIIMGTATVVKSSNGGGQIDLDFISGIGPSPCLLLSNDNALQSKGYLFIGDPNLVGTSIELSTYDGNLYLYSNTGTEINSSAVILLESPIEVSNNCTDNSTYQTGVYSSSAILPSTEIISQDYTSTSASVKVSSDGAISQLSTNGTYSSSVTINPDRIHIDTPTANLTLDPTNINLGSSGDVTIMGYKDGFQPQIVINDNRIQNIVTGLTYSVMIIQNEKEISTNIDNFISGSVQTTKSADTRTYNGIGTFSIPTNITLQEGQMVSISGIVNGSLEGVNPLPTTGVPYISSKFFCAFSKRDGVIYKSSDIFIDRINQTATSNSIFGGSPFNYAYWPQPVTNGIDIFIEVYNRGPYTGKIRWSCMYEYSKNLQP